MKKLFAFFEDHRHLALFLTLVSAGTLVFVYITQYVFHHEPCILCRYQRGPYFAALGFGLLAAVVAKRKPDIGFGLLLLAGAGFLVGLGISGYHIGVEQHWWLGPKACGGALPENATLEQLREYLTNRKIVDCGVPSWKFLGLTMTNYNFMMSLGLSVFTFVMAFKGRKKNGR
jgi:disulfide bond formation protein DsbB